MFHGRLSKSFYKNGFVSVIDDVVISKNLLDYYFKQLGKNRLAVFVLLPNLKELKKRDAKRTKSLRMGKRVAELFQEYQNRKSEKRWRIIDSSDLKPKQTIQRLLAELKNP